MSSTYRSNRNVVFSCKYHVVWCPKYRRSVLVEGAEEALKRIVERVCLARDADLIELEVMPDHVHLLVDVDPQCGIHRLIKEIKGTSSRELRASFPFLRSRLPSLWTNSYFVSTVLWVARRWRWSSSTSRTRNTSDGTPRHAHLHRRAATHRLQARRA